MSGLPIATSSSGSKPVSFFPSATCTPNSFALFGQSPRDRFDMPPYATRQYFEASVRNPEASRETHGLSSSSITHMPIVFATRTFDEIYTMIVLYAHQFYALCGPGHNMHIDPEQLKDIFLEAEA
ncbi:uncharacterized protein STEHIDRAFT_155753 [Stereum hirsutum FP-91666 SS1]|uniref:uncharacterized protein n=1 Tax=Stereum hirsutum (strain FP-91666) TaxID=721885 RepID=UPI000440CE15|nr:uncharacterized protein STEHIDRAFT_155753 [Stereum hirsutum FP-91666 SS1]EIM88399.1 hypothetical protein STEHIDRAFT_155753 [Stereum hirsutum FP-91666 SS1]